MDRPSPDSFEKPLDPAQERVVQRLRRISLVSSALMGIGFLAILVVVAYRVTGAGDRGAPPDVVATLPAGARVVSTSAAGDRLLVTIEVAGATEVRTFDARTLAPAGRLRFAREP